MDAADPLIEILEASRDEDGNAVYVVAQVGGELHVTLRRRPGAAPVKVDRGSEGYAVVYGVSFKVCAGPAHTERVIRAVLIPALAYG